MAKGVGVDVGLPSLINEPVPHHKAQKDRDENNKVFYSTNTSSWLPDGALIDQVHQETFFEEILAH